MRHALGVVRSMIRYVETEHPIGVFGVPGATLFTIGIALGLDVTSRYYASGPARDLAIGDAILTLLLIVMGMLLGFTGLILHAVIAANRRMR